MDQGTSASNFLFLRMPAATLCLPSVDLLSVPCLLCRALGREKALNSLWAFTGCHYIPGRVLKVGECQAM